MIRKAPSRLVIGLLAATFWLLAFPGFAKDAEAPTSEPASRAPRIRLLIDIPETHGAWRMVLDNQDVVPVRVVADARRLRLLVRPPGEKSYERCSLPDSMQGSSRERLLVLNPGEKYEEFFDPRMFCWGSKSEKLVPGTSVTAFLGWEPNPRLERRKQPQVWPFAAEPVLAPPLFASRKQLASLTHWLPDPDVVQANPEVRQRPPRFVGVPDLRLRTPRWADAVTHRDARISATLTNAGDRDALVHLRPDDLEVRVRRPDGTTALCGPGTGYRAAVRDFFTTIKPGKSASVTTLLSELCPQDIFSRSGLYILYVTLRVRDDGSNFRLQAVTGDFSAPRSTLLRVRSARNPYHPSPPQPFRSE